jgi:hypothetical protein
MLRRWRTLGFILVLTAGCGMGDDMAAPSSPSSTAGDAASSATGADPGRNAVPDVVVRDVATGADVSVRAAAARPDRPTLYWFWAPH